MENYAKQLERLIPKYMENNLKMKDYKKLVDEDNGKIKHLMKGNAIEVFEVGNLKASCTTSERMSFNEDALIEKLKELKTRGIVKKKEYVDMDALENAIYHGKLSAAELASCQETKEVVTLKVSKKKEPEVKL